MKHTFEVYFSRESFNTLFMLAVVSVAAWHCACSIYFPIVFIGKSLTAFFSPIKPGKHKTFYLL